MESVHRPVYARLESQRSDIREDRILEILPQSWALVFVELESPDQVLESTPKDDGSHYFRLLLTSARASSTVRKRSSPD